jgi:HEAT repeat protein
VSRVSGRRIKMKKSTLTVLITLALVISALPFRGGEDPAALKARVTDILARYPAQTAAERDAFSAEILKLGAADIGDICGRVLPPGGGDDGPARFALNGLAVYVSRTGAEKERLLYVQALLDAIRKAADKDVKAFFISQVQLSGAKESVRPLAVYLTDEKLADPAARAIQAAGRSEAAGVFLKALDSAPPAAKVTIIKALGETRSREAVKKILPYAESPDDKLRQAALFALADIGDPRAGRALERTRIAASPYERSLAPSLYLLYARRLVESGKQAEGLAIGRSLVEYYATPAESHIASSGLELIVSVLKDRALPDLLAAMDSPDRKFRGSALELSLSIPGTEATGRWVEKAASSPPDVRAEIVAMLGRRKDASALPAVRDALRSPDKLVRVAAIPAVVRLAGPAALPDILPFFNSTDSDEIAAAKEALLGFQDALVVPEAARLVDASPAPGKAALLEVLAAKGARDRIDLVFSQAASPEPAVRAAAIAALAGLAEEKDLPRLLDLLFAAADSEETVNLQKAVAAAAGRNSDPERRADALIALINGAPASHKAAILKVLPQAAGTKALQTVVGETGSKDSQVQAAAVYALSQWPDFGAADELLRIVSTAANKKYLLLALEGYVRLVNESDVPRFRKLDLLKKALGLPKDDADRKAVLRGVAAIRGPEAFRLLSESLGNPALRATAVQSLLEMASEQAPEERWLSGEQAVSILRRVEAQAENPAEKEQAAKIIVDRLRQGGFVPLFDGRSLDGWKGLVADPPARAKMTPEGLRKAQAAADDVMRAHWRVADGALVFDAKGESLCTVKDYGDFEMLVDWRIEKAGDSGIYLRGSPQVQIWDSAANPVGSGGLFNNQKGPSKPLEAADRPVGEWNTFRIIMIGERVTVYLSDRMVVDNTVLENYWERDKPIYSAGQIELQAHGNPLYFKNVYIREIPRDAAAPGLTDAEKEEGFASLFNGRDLSGWTGDTKGYAAENGRIVIYPERGSGNLYTEKEFSDFVFRFEFRLTPAANNGIGIRAPLEGDAAYAGMEIQVLEDGSPVYWDLLPYQFHGSIYGVVPARRGVLRPVGEWNTEEIAARGRRVTVTVNGTRIVDADIERAGAAGTIDHRDHPGLKREAGHIGFLGHGSIVEFRNIRIRELK